MIPSHRMNDAPNREELRKKKGSGFGLMNCKGIIEKYKKTNPIFNVCLFNVESALGKGSRSISGYRSVYAKL